MSARRYVESGVGWRVTAWYRGSGSGKYRIDMTNPASVISPAGVDDLRAALVRAQTAMADRAHPDTDRLRQLQQQSSSGAVIVRQV